MEGSFIFVRMDFAIKAHEHVLYLKKIWLDLLKINLTINMVFVALEPNWQNKVYKVWYQIHIEFSKNRKLCDLSQL
jgi:hypothetical protein